jgi:hypothetical protein
VLSSIKPPKPIIVVRTDDSGINIALYPDDSLQLEFPSGKKIRIDMALNCIRVPLVNGVKINVEAKNDHSIIRFNGG